MTEFMKHVLPRFFKPRNRLLSTAVPFSAHDGKPITVVDRGNDCMPVKSPS